MQSLKKKRREKNKSLGNVKGRDSNRNHTKEAGENGLTQEIERPLSS